MLAVSTKFGAPVVLHRGRVVPVGLPGVEPEARCPDAMAGMKCSGVAAGSGASGSTNSLPLMVLVSDGSELSSPDSLRGLFFGGSGLFGILLLIELIIVFVPV